MNEMKSAKLVTDIVVIGAGIAGLMLAKKLGNLGFSVSLVEKENQFAGGASTRNEGWLHRGTYHANSIKDKELAIQVAQRCIYGYEQIMKYASEAVEDIDLPSFAILKNKTNEDAVTNRWIESGVSFEKLKDKTISSHIPEINIKNVGSAFLVKDVGINTKILYSKLLSENIKIGNKVFNNSIIEFSNNELPLMVNKFENQKIEINAKIFIHTTGYSTRQIYNEQFNVDIPIRFWKSHLLVVPRLSKCSAFFLDAGEAAMMNHDDHSIIGLNEDAFECSSPDLEPMKDKIQNIIDATTRLFNITTPSKFIPIACIKPDVPLKSTISRSLNINILEPTNQPTHICALPGKMTETPFLTDVLTKMIYERVSDKRISSRPMDNWNNHFKN
jgi:glycerol-3-phosphate dehydrogenase